MASADFSQALVGGVTDRLGIKFLMEGASVGCCFETGGAIKQIVNTCLQNIQRGRWQECCASQPALLVLLRMWSSIFKGDTNAYVKGEGALDSSNKVLNCVVSVGAWSGSIVEWSDGDAD